LTSYTVPCRAVPGTLCSTSRLAWPTWLYLPFTRQRGPDFTHLWVGLGSSTAGSSGGVQPFWGLLRGTNPTLLLFCSALVLETLVSQLTQEVLLPLWLTHFYLLPVCFLAIVGLGGLFLLWSHLKQLCMALREDATSFVVVSWLYEGYGRSCLLALL
jgi:hypothetical protein